MRSSYLNILDSLRKSGASDDEINQAMNGLQDAIVVISKVDVFLETLKFALSPLMFLIVISPAIVVYLINKDSVALGGGPWIIGFSEGLFVESAIVAIAAFEIKRTLVVFFNRKTTSLRDKRLVLSAFIDSYTDSFWNILLFRRTVLHI
jgi:hypothetical protein